MQNNVVDELAKIINEMNQIVSETERIQTLSTISQNERDNLRKGTATLKELSERIIELSNLNLEDEFIKERLKQVGESLEELVKNRVKIDSQKNLSSKSFYNEITQKMETSKIEEGKENEKYGERGELEANTELVKELVNELETYTRKNLNERLAEAIQNRSKILPEEEEIRRLENIDEELSKLNTRREEILAKGRRKQELDTKLIKLCESIDSSMTEKMKTAIKFEVYDDVVQQIIELLHKKVENQFEEYKLEKKMIEKGMNSLTPEQIKEFEQKRRTEIGESERKIKDALRSLEELKQIKEETKEEKIEEIKQKEKALKEERDNIVFEREVRPLRMEIQRGIEELPPELRQSLIEKANRNNLNIIMSPQEQTSDQKSIEFYKTQLEYLEERLARIEKRIQATKDIYDNEINQNLNNGPKVTRITEEKQQAIAEIQKEKESLEAQIRDLRNKISKYNTISKKIDDLIFLLQNRTKASDERSDERSEEEENERTQTTPQEEPAEDTALVPADDNTALVPVDEDPKDKEPEGKKMPGTEPNEEPKQEEVKSKRKSKLSKKLKKIIIIAAGVIAVALASMGGKKEKNVPDPNSIVILPAEEELAPKPVPKPVPKPAETEPQEEEPETQLAPKPITEEVLKSAVEESGMIQNSGENEFDVQNGTGNGIKEENVQWYYDQGTLLHFEKDEKTGSWKVIERQKDGSLVALKWTGHKEVIRYALSIANSTNRSFEDIYRIITGENMQLQELNEYFSIDELAEILPAEELYKVMSGGHSLRVARTK